MLFVRDALILSRTLVNTSAVFLVLQGIGEHDFVALA